MSATPASTASSSSSPTSSVRFADSASVLYFYKTDRVAWWGNDAFEVEEDVKWRDDNFQVDKSRLTRLLDDVDYIPSPPVREGFAGVANRHDRYRSSLASPGADDDVLSSIRRPPAAPRRRHTFQRVANLFGRRPTQDKAKIGEHRAKRETNKCEVWDVDNFTYDAWTPPNHGKDIDIYRTIKNIFRQAGHFGRRKVGRR